ncbi:unnamed protein product [Adineta steineri]|uniref:PLAT domain-containing protein n=1 Tax=Adineta steineri TaxID=433720 RepID=A0A813XI77_9BILA|nr:unnamed protein product [Adineta steineri]
MRLIFKSIIIISIIIIPYCLAEDWSITVYTGTERFAGTDSNVYIRLFNSQGESTSEYQLTHNNWMPEHEFPVRNLFERGARERFEIKTEDIKTVAKIQNTKDYVNIFNYSDEMK